MPPNPDLAHAFYLAGYIESWGQGISKICDACIADGIDLPVYNVAPDSVMVVLKTTEAKARGLDGIFSSTKGGRNGGRNGGRKDGEVAQVLEILSRNPSATQKEIAEQTAMTRRQVERCFAKLKESGKIIRVGSMRSGIWEISEEE